MFAIDSAPWRLEQNRIDLREALPLSLPQRYHLTGSKIPTSEKAVGPHPSSRVMYPPGPSSSCLKRP